MSSRKPGDETVLQSLRPKRELRKGCYCNKRTRIRTSTVMSRAAITTLPIWNALRRSYLNPLFLLRPIVSFSASSRRLFLKASHPPT
jgi:hypothetical protein